MNSSSKAPQDAVSLLRKPGTKAQPAHNPTSQPIAQEQAKKSYVPFSSRITVENQQALDQLAYWSRAAKVDILNDALEAYFSSQPESKNPIPSKRR